MRKFGREYKVLLKLQLHNRFKDLKRKIVQTFTENLLGMPPSTVTAGILGLTLVLKLFLNFSPPYPLFDLCMSSRSF